ncbi:MAG: NAD(P)-dependent oxidoreductase [Acidobacteriota bacterium]|nr:NAD(P)-dependent oxidoreductase [Acidobacteriota bacterium]
MAPSADRLLLTGAGGFLGRNCLDALGDSGWEVHAADREIRRDTPPSVHWHEVDLLDDQAVRDLMTRIEPSHLLHLAWTGARPVYRSCENFQWVGASLALFRHFAACGGGRIVALGSSAEYEEGPYDCREDVTPLTSATPYGVCKSSLFRLFEAWRREAGVSGAWARPFFLYGPYEHESRLVASVIVSLLRREPARCTHGRQVRDYLHSRDAAAALLHLLASDFDGAVNIGSGKPVAVADLVRLIARQMGKEDLVELGAIPAPDDEAPRVVADVRRLVETVGWQPRFNVEEGLAQTIEWWQRELAGGDVAAEG